MVTMAEPPLLQMLAVPLTVSAVGARKTVTAELVPALMLAEYPLGVAVTVGEPPTEKLTVQVPMPPDQVTEPNVAVPPPVLDIATVGAAVFTKSPLASTA
jgi:hypothetical protein